MPEDNRAFDVRPPGQGSPHANGRPVVVGHHPTMADPMLRPMHHSAPRVDMMSPTPHVQPTHATGPTPSMPVPQVAPVLPPQPTVPQSPSVAFSSPDALTVAPTSNSLFESAGQVAASAQKQGIYTTPAPSTASAQMPGTNPLQPIPASPQNTAMSSAVDQVQHASHHELPIIEKGNKKSGFKKLILLFILPLLILGAGVYLVVDAQVIKNDIKLPIEFFKEKSTTSSTTPNTTTQTSTSTQPVNTVPAGYSAYDDSALPFSFNYPTVWGTPTVTTEQGFSKRGGDNKSDGTYAYLVNFAANKDVQMAITSAKFLPPARGALYYDFLTWCVNPSDNKFYKSVMAFTTAAGVDTATQSTCNQGPLQDATKIDDTTIVQTDTKAADGSSLGDVYTKNLGDATIAVVRIKDATRKNGNDIKIILNNDTASATGNTGGAEN